MDCVLKSFVEKATVLLSTARSVLALCRIYHLFLVVSAFSGDLFFVEMRLESLFEIAHRCPFDNPDTATLSASTGCTLDAQGHTG